ncbi:30S ribosomal protein S15 [Pelagibacteraceae bacterium]|nr:30S ribosomal protein S15 [Pelagibacteraceae bacterium]|tara:strand:- start:6 stop:278 length:273 start_codon:yes stop_codon:yes gene_type:complete
MSISKESKKKFIDEFSKNKNDTGSTSIQIAVITERIKNLTEHFKTHNKDNHSKRGLVALVNQRKKLLNYLSKKNNDEYLELIKKLNIRGK